MAEPEFFYDFNSPFAYLGASRVDDVLPVRPRWRPIAFGVIVRQSGKRPWSFDEDTRGGVIDEIAVRAADRGLPPLRYPEGWPVESCSLAPLRAAVVAEDAGRLHGRGARPGHRRSADGRGRRRAVLGRRPSRGRGRGADDGLSRFRQPLPPRRRNRR